MKFGEKNSYGIFFSKNGKKNEKNDKKDMPKMVDVLPKSCWRRDLRKKSVEADPTSNSNITEECLHP